MTVGFSFTVEFPANSRFIRKVMEIVSAWAEKHLGADEFRCSKEDRSGPVFCPACFANPFRRADGLNELQLHHGDLYQCPSCQGLFYWDACLQRSQIN